MMLIGYRFPVEWGWLDANTEILKHLVELYINSSSYLQNMQYINSSE